MLGILKYNVFMKQRGNLSITVAIIREIKLLQINLLVMMKALSTSLPIRHFCAVLFLSSHLESKSIHMLNNMEYQSELGKYTSI